jgi:hypothetical protein
MSWIDNSPLTIWGAEPFERPIADPGLFREAMSRLGAAVHIVTTQGKAGKAGFTATAVASVSDTPPTILVCLNRKSQITPVMRENKVFCVNTLASHDEELANVFAGRKGHFMADRFEHGDWATLETGARQCDRGDRLPGAGDEVGRDPRHLFRRSRGDPSCQCREGAGLPRARLQARVMCRRAEAAGVVLATAGTTKNQIPSSIHSR